MGLIGRMEQCSLLKTEAFTRNAEATAYSLPLGFVSSLKLMKIKRLIRRGRLAQMGELLLSKPAIRGPFSSKAKIYQQIDGTSFSLVAMKCASLTLLNIL